MKRCSSKVRVATLDGAVELAIPPGTNSGRTFRLKGKGLSRKSGAGDLYATVRIMLPERKIPISRNLCASGTIKSPTIHGRIRPDRPLHIFSATAGVLFSIWS